MSLIVGLSMVREALVLALSPSTQNLCHAALLLAEARELQADWCNNVGFSGCKVPDAGIQRIQQLLGELAAEPFILERIRRNQGKGGFQTFLNNERIQRARAMAKRLLIEFQAGRGRHRRKSGRMNRTSLAKEVMDTCMAPTTVEKVRKWLREFEADPERT
ncbi:MAG: hypothetical protein KDI37_11545 [Xanthomonadales bacterium]|nr:hypothetical protein [Xanthomonadales bacterium]MCB1642358.1 hypothetical protein [Xanthomonadales bacterium]